MKLANYIEYWWCNNCEAVVPANRVSTGDVVCNHCPECDSKLYGIYPVPAHVAEAYDAVVKAARTFIMDESVEFCDGLQGIEDSIKALDALPQEATDD